MASDRGDVRQPSRLPTLRGAVDQGSITGRGGPRTIDSAYAIPMRVVGRLCLVALLVGACDQTTPSMTPSIIVTTPSGAPNVKPCSPSAAMGVLPEWARAGFNEPEPTALQAMGASGEIVAILFGATLFAPPNPELSNKILWVARDPAGGTPLDISAQQMDGDKDVGEPIERQVGGGPGPSTIDLPEPGCWRLSLTWDDRTDWLDLEYEPFEAGGGHPLG